TPRIWSLPHPTMRTTGDLSRLTATATPGGSCRRTAYGVSRFRSRWPRIDRWSSSHRAHCGRLSRPAGGAGSAAVNSPAIRADPPQRRYGCTPRPRCGLSLAQVRALLDLVLPVHCPGCGAAGVLACPACLAPLAAPARVAWPRPSPAGLPPPFAVASYGGAVRAILLAYKEDDR